MSDNIAELLERARVCQTAYTLAKEHSQALELECREHRRAMSDNVKAILTQLDEVVSNSPIRGYTATDFSDKDNLQQHLKRALRCLP